MDFRYEYNYQQFSPWNHIARNGRSRERNRLPEHCRPIYLQHFALPLRFAGHVGHAGGIVGDSARVQFSITGPAGTVLDIVLSDGIQNWTLNGVGHGGVFRLLPAQTLNINIISAVNAGLPVCPVSLPAPVEVRVEALREAGMPLTGSQICAFADSLLSLTQLLAGADAGGQWSLFPGSTQPFAGTFQPGTDT